MSSLRNTLHILKMLLQILIIISISGCLNITNKLKKAPLTSDTTSSIAVSSGNFQSIIAGNSFSSNLIVLVKDSKNNPASGVAIDWSSSTGSLGVTSSTTDVNGHASNSLNPGTVAGTNTVTATIRGTTISTIFTLTVSPASASALTSTISALPLSLSAGSTATVTMIVKDQYGNAIPNQTTSFVSTGSTNTIIQLTSVTDSNGRVTGTISSTLAETKTLSFSFPVALSGVSSPLTFNPGTISHFTLSGLLASVTAGASNSITVTAKDAYLNNVTNYRGTVSFSSNDSQAVLPVNYTFTAGDNGTHIFSGVILKTAGSKNITVTDTVTETITTTQSAITVSPTVADHLVKVAGDNQSSNISSTVAINPQVQVLDVYGNAVQGKVLTFTPAAGASVGSSSITTDTNGYASTSFTVGTTIGATSLVVAGFTALPGTPSSVLFNFTTTAGAPTQIAISTGNDQTVTAGSSLAIDPEVVVKDVANNVVQGATVLWSTTSGTLSAASTTTDAQGKTSISYTPEVTPGVKNLTATIQGTASTTNFTVTVQANMIDVNVELSRQSGVAPLSVFFDASASTTPTTTKPFLDMQCTWNFGDDDTVTWEYGAHVGDGSILTKKNRFLGMVASHVYEQPGTYTPTVTCTDGVYTTPAISLDPITVTDPNNVFLGNNTICFAANSMPVPGTDVGCPAGSSAINATATYGSADFDQIINANAISGKRLLFKRGDIFYSSTTASVTGTLGLIGAYGSGAKPLIRLSGVPLYVLSIGSSATQAEDWRVMDLDIDGQATSTLTTIALTSRGSAKQVLFLRMDVHDIGTGYNFSSTFLDTWNKVGNVTTLGSVLAADTVFQVNSVGSATVGMGATISSTNGGNEFSVKNIPDFSGTTITAIDSVSTPNTITLSHPVGVDGPVVGTTMNITFWNLPFNPVHKIWDQIAIVDSKIERMWGGGGALGIYMAAKRVTIMGSLVHDCRNSEFNIRVLYAGTGVISQNTLSLPSSNKSVLTLRAPSFMGGPTIPHGTYTEKVIISDNKMVSNLDSTSVSIMPKNETSDERHRFVIFERNWVISGVNTTMVLSINNANNDAIRNNIFDGSLAAGGSAVSFGGNGKAAPDTTYGNVYNNVFYKGSAGTSGMYLAMVTVGSTNMTIKNNLMYAPLVTPGVNVFSVLRNLAGAGVVSSNNTADGNLTTDPNFLVSNPTTPTDFSIMSNSYGAGAGTSVPVWDDFFGNSRSGSIFDLGAIIQP